jgi:16S rRNA (cytosine967-C5)-methyltransferase
MKTEIKMLRRPPRLSRGRSLRSCTCVRDPRNFICSTRTFSRHTDNLHPPPRPAKASVAPARAAAFDILLRVERESSYAAELLHASAHANLSTPDHALATELVMGVLRWRSRLDADIATASSQPLSRLDLEILIALRLALYQFLWLDRIPRRAALHESVELVKRARKRSAAPFVNAVLRKLSTAPPNHIANEAEISSPEALARALAHPLWLVERWTRDYGLAAAHQICQHNQSVPTTAIRLRAPTAEQQLNHEGISLIPGGLLTSARRVQTGDITKTQAFRTGQIVIQDEASQLVAALVGPATLKEGARILDCCSAPGGKTLAIADHNPSAAITAVELHPHRARLLQSLLRQSLSNQSLSNQNPSHQNSQHSADRNSGSCVGRGLRAGQAERGSAALGQPNPLSTARIQIVTADAQHLPVSVQFDHVLADVPCSGTGTLARNPEIKWRLTADDLTELSKRQLAILRSALAQVAPGGRLIYSTCSLEKEENESVVEQALAENNSFRLLDCRIELNRLKESGELTWSYQASPDQASPEPTSLTSGPYLRTIPGVHPCDGFFAAILEKV